MREFGLDVEYNGKNYYVFSEGNYHEYAQGEMACELMRLKPSELKETIIKAPHFHDQLNRKQFADIIVWLKKQLNEQCTLIVAEMLIIDFANKSLDYFNSSDEEKANWINQETNIADSESITEYILKDTGYQQFGTETNGQFLLSLYFMVIYEYCLCVAAFTSILKSDEDPKEYERAVKLFDFYSLENSSIQDIEFSILCYDNRFNSIYKIKSAFSLVLFETAHIIDNDIKCVKCRCCGHYFVPRKRSDTRYCNYPSPDNPEKTCKEIGAQKTWATKEKTDDVTREYRKIYMRYKMKVNRHPDDRRAQEKLTELTNGIKQWRQKLNAGETQSDDFFRWLEQF